MSGTKTSTRRPAGGVVAARRDVILDAASELFAKRGYDGTGMADIAKAAGLSKPGIYHHFRDKDEIFSSISIATLESICLHVEQSIQGIEDPGERLLAFMVAHADYFDRNRGRYTATQFAFLRMTDEPRRTAAVRLRDRYEAGLRSIFVDGTNQGAFRAIDPSLATRTVLSVLNSFARWHQQRGPMSATDVARGVFTLLMDGFRPPS
jgi:AcrR family transcriptional regulator